MPPSAQARSRSRVPLARAMLAATLATASLAAAPVTPALAAEPPIRVAVGECFVGMVGPGLTPVTARIRSANGTIRASIDGATDLDGSESFQCNSTRIRGGDRIEIRATVTGDLIARFTVPSFRAVLDRDTDRITIHGPKGAQVELDPITCSPGLVNCGGGWHLFTRTLDSKGRTTIDTTPYVDLGGADGVELRSQTAKGGVSWRFPMPHLDVLVGAAKVSGTGSIGRSVGLVLRDSGGSVRGKGAVKAGPPTGTFSATIRRSNGKKIAPAVGDRVGAPALGSNARVTLATIPVTLGVSSFQLGCAPASPYSYEIVDGLRRFTSNGGVTDGSGIANGAFSPDLVHGYRLVIRCGTAAGDMTRTALTLP